MALVEGTYLYDVVEQIRSAVDEPSADSKYDDNWLLRHVVQPSQVDVISRVNLQNDKRVHLYHEFTTSTTQKRYALPPDINRVMRLVQEDARGNVIMDVVPENFYAPSGWGWRVEGNVLVFQNAPTRAITMRLWYQSNGDFYPVQYDADSGEDGAGTALVDISGGGTKIWLPNDTLGGSWDRRQGAYAGAIIRLIPDTGYVPVEELVIKDFVYDTGANRWYLTTFDKVQDVESVFTNALYSGEIIQFPMKHLHMAIGYRGALLMSQKVRMSQSQRRSIQEEFRQAMKTVMDELVNAQARLGNRYERNTVDNMERREASFIAESWR